MKYPRSAYDKTGGLFYFARMIDKIRLSQAGELPPDYLSNLGTAIDGRRVHYFQVDYLALVKRVKSGESALTGEIGVMASHGGDPTRVAG